MNDPLLVFYAGCALYREADGKARWLGFSHRLTDLLVKTQERGPELGGTWKPQGAFGADGGRICTTAVHVLMLQLYYRYSRLAVASQLARIAHEHRRENVQGQCCQGVGQVPPAGVLHTTSRAGCRRSPWSSGDLASLGSALRRWQRWSCAFVAGGRA